MHIIPSIYEETNSLQRQDAKLILDQLKADFKDKQCEKVVDIGCGTGNITIDINKYINVNEIIAFDISKEMIAFANKVHYSNNIRYVCCDASDDWNQMKACLGIEDNSVDIVISVYCLHWVSSISKALENIYNMLKSGGKFYIIIFTYSNWTRKLDDIIELPRWKNFFKLPLINILQSAEERLEKIEILLKTNKFINTKAKLINADFKYKNQETMHCEIRQLCYPMKYIPAADHEDFFKDYIDLAKGDNSINKEALNYEFAFIYGEKP